MSENFSHPNAQPFLLEAGEDAVLLIHGFTGAPGHMRVIGEAVQKAGFTARGIRLPGHGETVEKMMQSGAQQWLDACCEAYQEMCGRYRHVSVGGLSMGGILATLLAEEFEPACLVLFAPAMKYRSQLNYLSPVVKYLCPTLRWPSNLGRKDFLYEYDYGYEKIPVGKVEDMTHLQRKACAGLAAVTCPTLVIQSHKDEQVHISVPEIVTRGVSSQVREICWVDNSSHVCTIGPDRAYVCARVIDFLRRYGV